MTISDTPLEAAPPAPLPPPPARRGWLAVAAGIVAWPRNTFAYLRDHGGRSWLLPLALALALTVAARLVAQPIERAQAEALQAQLEAQLDALQNGDGATDGGAVFVTGPMGGPGGLIGATGGPTTPNAVAEFGIPLLGVLGDWALRGGVLLALAWVLGGRPAAGSMFRMSSWTLLPDIVRLLVALGVMVTVGRIPVRGLNAFSPGSVAQINVSAVENGDGQTVDGEAVESGDGGDVMVFGPGGGTTSPNSAPPILLFLQTSFLGSLDVYLLWALGLMLVGVAVTARLGWLKAGLATLLYFGLSVALGALPPLLSLYLMRLTGPSMLGP